MSSALSQTDTRKVVGLIPARWNFCTQKGSWRNFCTVTRILSREENMKIKTELKTWKHMWCLLTNRANRTWESNRIVAEVESEMSERTCFWLTYLWGQRDVLRGRPGSSERGDYWWWTLPLHDTMTSWRTSKPHRPERKQRDETNLQRIRVKSMSSITTTRSDSLTHRSTRLFPDDAKSKAS